MRLVSGNERQVRVSEMKITIETINHHDQRYPTVGDWQWKAPDELLIRVSDTGAWRSTFLVALHELVEAMLCRQARVSEAAVDAFDMGPGAHLDEPGELPDAPYHDQHVIAHIVERIVAQALKVEWTEHEERIAGLE